MRRGYATTVSEPYLLGNGRLVVSSCVKDSKTWWKKCKGRGTMSV